MTNWKPPELAEGDEWKPPTFMEKVEGFTVAFADWREAGYPRRSPEWVVEIFDTHCEPCDWYDPDARTPLGSKGVCRRCACHVSPDPEDMLNKIVLPNTSCPLKRPKWESSIEKRPAPFTPNNWRPRDERS